MVRMVRVVREKERTGEKRIKRKRLEKGKKGRKRLEKG